MRQIRSRHFQIFGKDEYWRDYWLIVFVKVGSRYYPSIYARTPKNILNIRNLPILGHSWRIDICVFPPLYCAEIEK